MTFVDTLAKSVTDAIDAEIALIETEILKMAKPLNAKATIALGEELHERVTRHYAPKIASAMRDVDGIEEAIETAQRMWWPTAIKASDDEVETPAVTPLPSGAIAGGTPDLGPIPSDIALSAIASNVSLNLGAIQSVLTDLYNDAGLVGEGIAAQHLGIPASDTVAVLDGINWSKWTPGDLRSAQLVANGGLKSVLDDAQTTIQGISDSMLERMGNILAEGLNQGLAPKTIANNMKELGLTDARANLISRTESARAMTLTSLATYRENGTKEIQWHSNLGACKLCEALDDKSPYDIDAVPTYPAHANERCQLLPYFADL